MIIAEKRVAPLETCADKQKVTVESVDWQEFEPPCLDLLIEVQNPSG